MSGGKFEFDEISNIVIVIESVLERNLTVTIDGTCFIYRRFLTLDLVLYKKIFHLSLRSIYTRFSVSLLESYMRIRSYPLILSSFEKSYGKRGREKKKRKKEREIINVDRRTVEAIGKTRRDPVVRWSGCRNVRLRYSRSGCPDGEVSWSD